MTDRPNEREWFADGLRRRAAMLEEETEKLRAMVDALSARYQQARLAFDARHHPPPR